MSDLVRQRLMHHLGSLDFWVALYASDQFRASYSPVGEVKSAGYTPGGAKVSTKQTGFQITVTEDVVWPDSNIRAGSALVYDRESRLGYFFFDFPEKKSVRDEFRIAVGGQPLFSLEVP